MADVLRLAALVAALSLVTDLGMGQPMEQAPRTCLIALGLVRRMGLEPDDMRDVYYVALLRFLGCTSDAYENAAIVGGDELAFRAAVAPVLGGTPGEFMRHVLPAITTEAVMTFMLKAGALIPTSWRSSARMRHGPGRVAAAHTIARELRALNDDLPDLERVNLIDVAVLMIIGEQTDPFVAACGSSWPASSRMRE